MALPHVFIGRKNAKSEEFIVIFRRRIIDFKGTPDFRHTQMGFKDPSQARLKVLTQAFPGSHLNANTKFIYTRKNTGFRSTNMFRYNQENVRLMLRLIDIPCILALAMLVCK